MAKDGAIIIYNSITITDAKTNPFSLKAGLNQMLCDRTIVEVTTQNKLVHVVSLCRTHLNEAFLACQTHLSSRK